MSIRIERADPSQAELLCAIEREAVQLFRGHAAWASYSAVTLPVDVVRHLITRGFVWVAVDGDAVVGFVCLDVENGGDTLGIAEIDVLPSHGRRGIGAALLEHACEWAREAGYRRVDLGTLADVPWNAPFYAKHGFVEMDKSLPEFAFALERDRENGFPDHLRVFMSRALAPLAPGDGTVWPAPAKLNLFLRITGRRPDGYHELQTVFRLLDWGDEVRIRVRADGVISRPIPVPGVSEDDDLTVRAARLLARHTGTPLGADIEVRKRIPMGGGLGGGSSDAATVLVALNALWETNLSENDLAGLGLSLGADVPVFVRGRSAWAEGVGEKLSPIKLPKRWYVVLDPREHVPTAALFQSPELTRNAPPATISSFVSGDSAENAFEPVVRARHPRVAAALDWLGRHGRARLSGSGGCVFLETRTYEAALAVALRCPEPFVAHVAAGVDPSPLHSARQRIVAHRMAKG
ncbi:4-diphosphocytidyl-2-C-methyl-D-erythritol kinase [Luteibacter sp. Sphag1AF]|uniref:4-(cytidine 5'-diphospho)-2-C-methyl-D-erythritol kinase n=1 Tax=Luteibacter sp. Sphag1AF TaxID=2587031 RepID=UPI00160AA071|nr:4-(cytidine 5'-diphospho)-2-C-methyl-D-erythritol kinase [Luteibacter sp. Sphag1AF]MBB3227462.1 4-diphosphocytidyl-2-C-methyl-D-erythritol kinase [Luteibacter sp. Sphag1AF]